MGLFYSPSSKFLFEGSYYPTKIAISGMNLCGLYSEIITYSPGTAMAKV